MLAVAAVTATPAAGGRVHRVVRHQHDRSQPVRHRPAARATCAGEDASAEPSSLTLMRSAVICLLNRERTKRGLPTLAASRQLNGSAQAWTNTMVRTGRFTHGPGDAFARRISAAGYDWQTAGENIATGFPTPRSVVAGWIASTDHCRNILNPDFRNVGTGERGSPVGRFASGPATWTQDFGLRIGQPARSRNRRPMDGCPY
jgi:uncharacterized protein YkwD